MEQGLLVWFYFVAMVRVQLDPASPTANAMVMEMALGWRVDIVLYDCPAQDGEVGYMTLPWVSL